MATIIEASEALQTAIYLALDKNVKVRFGKKVPICDYISENLPMPYIQIGDDELVDNSTKDLMSFIATADVNIYSDWKGFKEVKKLAAIVNAALVDIDESILDWNVRCLSVSKISFDSSNYNQYAECIISAKFLVSDTKM